MKLTFLISVITLYSFLNIHVHAFCVSLFCSYMPLMAKSCCSVTKRCCIQYQSWLSPLINNEDVLDEYLDAITHEVYSDNVQFTGIPGMPPPFMNIGRLPPYLQGYGGIRRYDSLAESSQKLSKFVPAPPSNSGSSRGDSKQKMPDLLMAAANSPSNGVIITSPPSLPVIKGQPFMPIRRVDTKTPSSLSVIPSVKYV